MKTIKRGRTNVDKTQAINFRDKSCNFVQDWLGIIWGAVLRCGSVLSGNWFRRRHIAAIFLHITLMVVFKIDLIISNVVFFLSNSINWPKYYSVDHICLDQGHLWKLHLWWNCHTHKVVWKGFFGHWPLGREKMFNHNSNVSVFLIWPLCASRESI